MTAEKTWRAMRAAVFLIGVLACLDVLRDNRVLWPPDVLWAGLRSQQRLELGGGIALILVTLLSSVLRGNH
jgi:hypothetical protein